MDPVRLIAMDMDGTLLNPRQKISQENLIALQKAESQGVQLAVCSGRIANDISFFLSDAGLHHCAVLALNGACCLDHPHAPDITEEWLCLRRARSCKPSI